MFSVLSVLPQRGTSAPVGDVEVIAAWLGELDLAVPWTPRYDAVELALLDAVFSIRTTYGTPTTGVRAWVTAYAEAADARGDDLARLAEAGDVLAALADEGRLTRQRVFTGQLKIDAAVAAAGALAALPDGPRTAADLRAAIDERYDELLRAYTSVPGLGAATFEYFLMLCGAPGERAKGRWWSFACEAVQRGLEDEEAEYLLEAVARRLGLEPAQLLHAVWRAR